MAGRRTRSGGEFSPYSFQNAPPLQTNRVSLQELLVLRSQSAPDSDTESLVGSDNADSDNAARPSPPPEPERRPSTFVCWVYPPALPAPKPILERVIRCARPGAPPDPRPATFERWVTPPAPPAPKPYLERVIRCAPHPPKPARSVAAERRLEKKRGHDRRIRRGNSLKAITQLRVRRSVPIQLELNIEDYPLPVASSGWMGVRQDEPDACAYGLDELLELDPEFEVLEWDGTPRPVLDRDRRVLFVLGGIPPNATDWQEDVADAAATAMQSAADKIYSRREAAATSKTASKAANEPRRGPHAAEHVGPAMGGGQRYPMNLHHSVVNMAIFLHLFGLKCFEHLAGWTNVLFYGFAPDLHGFYSKTMDDLFTWDAMQDRAKHLSRNFAAALSVFATATFNFGPATVTFPHIDFGNLAWGWCAITALGWFNPDLGGHLILWDLKLIIRFPPGSTILIPSAILRHSNTKIQPGERRFSFTQFTPAGIFRWVYNGFRTDREIDASRRTTEEEHEQRRGDRATRWQEGIRMYRTWPSPASSA